MEKDKEIEEEPKPQSFVVKMEVMVPVTITYKITAKTPEEAIDICTKGKEKHQSAPPKIHYIKMKKIKAKVYKSGTSNVVLTK